MMRKVDAILDALYLAESMNGYAASLVSESEIAAFELKQSFYSEKFLPFSFLEMIVFLSFSYVAKLNTYNIKNHFIVNSLVLFWPYFRDFISGLKNGRHATFNFCYLLQHSVAPAIYHLVNPIGIGVGVILAFVLTWYRYMSQKRLSAIKYNRSLLGEDYTYLQIRRHSCMQKILNYLAAGFDGLTDGLYLYGCLFLLFQLGAFPITGGAPFIVIIFLICFFSLISKLHDEYLVQKDFDAAVLECERRLKSEDLCSLTAKPIYPQTTFSFVGKFGFFFFRGALSGAKNAAAAVDLIKAMIPVTVNFVFIGALKIFLAIGYSTYLAVTAAQLEFNKWKQNDCVNRQFRRNDFV